jgi:hypothetical protein
VTIALSAFGDGLRRAVGGWRNRWPSLKSLQPMEDPGSGAGQLTTSAVMPLREQVPECDHPGGKSAKIYRLDRDV